MSDTETAPVFWSPFLFCCPLLASNRSMHFPIGGGSMRCEVRKDMAMSDMFAMPGIVDPLHDILAAGEDDIGRLISRLSDVLASETVLPGTRLPSRRVTAARFGLSVTLTDRIYRALESGGLIYTTLRSGSYYALPVPARVEPDAAVSPPRLRNQLPRSSTSGILAEELARRHAGPATRVADVTLDDRRLRKAAGRWLAERIPDASRQRIVATGGGHEAIHAVLKSLTVPGDVIFAEELTYSGIHSIAGKLGLSVIPIQLDRSGLIVDDLEHMLGTLTPKAIYCNPTFQNPGVTTLPNDRREKLANLARRYHVPIIEDDPYGAMFAGDTVPVSVFARNYAYYISSMSKSVSSALRVGFVLTPNVAASERLIGALSAIGTGLKEGELHYATDLIIRGEYCKIVLENRNILKERISVSESILEEVDCQISGFHIWINCNGRKKYLDISEIMRKNKINYSDGIMFSTNRPYQGIRIPLDSSFSIEDVARLSVRLQTIIP